MNMYTNLYQNSQCFAQNPLHTNEFFQSCTTKMGLGWSDTRPSDKSVQQKKNSYFSTKTYVVDTQKNRLNETVLLSNQIIC